MQIHRSAASVPLEQSCPVRDVLDRIGDRWSLLILLQLEKKDMRFNELGRQIPDVSKQMLSMTLKRLEQDGLITRTMYAEVPVRVEYALTQVGQSFIPVIKSLIGWAEANHPAILQAQASFEARPD